MHNRIGIGYDIHRFVKGRELVLGGVAIPHSKGLDGHSDADVVLHAVSDALLGAVGKGDIGEHFPNTDKNTKTSRAWCCWTRYLRADCQRRIQGGQRGCGHPGRGAEP